jgi:hypothetical protein
MSKSVSKRDIPSQISVEVEPAAAAVQRFVKRHPSVRDCLKRNLLNLSATARAIGLEILSASGERSKVLSKPRTINRAALVMALRRLRARLGEGTNERALMSVVQGAKLSVSTGLGVAIFARSQVTGDLRAYLSKERERGGVSDQIEISDVLVVFGQDEVVLHLKRSSSRGLLRSHLGLARVELLFGPQIETTSGVVAFIYSLLAERGINVLEEVSCWNKVVVLVRMSDLSAAVAALADAPHQRSNS